MSEKFFSALQSTIFLFFGMASGLSLADEEAADPEDSPEVIQLEALPAQVQTLADLARMLPGVAWQWRDFSGESSGTGLSLRGAGATSGVPIVFAGVRLPVTVSLEDVEAAALMSGAQGVTLGAGATAGALLLSPAEPQLGETLGLLQGHVSQQAVAFEGGENHQVTGVINLPVGERFAVRFATGNGKRRGVIDYTGLYEVNRFNEPALLEPRRRLESAAVIAPSEGPDEAGVDFARLGMLWQPSNQLRSTFFYHAESGLADARSYSAPGSRGAQPEIRVREEASRDLDLASFDIEWQLQGGVLSARTGWLNTRAASLDDRTGLFGTGQQLPPGWPRPLVLETRRGAASSLVQDVGFESAASEGLAYRLGLRYERQRANYESALSLPGYAQWLQAGGDGVPLQDLPGSLLPSTLKPESRDISVAAALDWAPAERWRFGAGARLIDTRVTAGLSALDARRILFEADAVYEAANKTEWFARLAQGYGPGLPTRMATLPPVPVGSRPVMSQASGMLGGRAVNLQEWSDTVELGTEGGITLPAGRSYELTYRAAVFATRREADFLVVDELGGGINDLAEKVVGIDIQAGLVAGPFALTAGLMLADRDTADEPLWAAPEQVGNLGGEYRRSVFGDKSLVMTLSGYFQSGNDTPLAAAQDTEDYQLWDLGVELRAQGWDVNLFLKNLGNADAITGADNGQIFRLLPRTLGVGVAYRF